MQYKITSLFKPADGKAFWTNVPLLALLAANIAPLYGVLMLDWSVFYIVLLYWAENLVIGFYNILKIAFVKVEHPIEHLVKLFMIPFFTVHYGMFTAIHGIFVVTIFSENRQGPDMNNTTWPCFFAFIQMIGGFFRDILISVPPGIRLAMLLLFVSHGVSFVYNYLIKGEYAKTNPGNLMGRPYARVFVMHITIIAGGFLLMATGSPGILLVVLIGLKTIIDIKLHLHEHKKAVIRK